MHLRSLCAGALALVSMAACGGGTIAVASGLGGDSSGGSSPAQVTTLVVSETKRSPASISFKVVNQAAPVRLGYRAGGVECFLTGVPSNPTAPVLGDVQVDWDFTLEGPPCAAVGELLEDVTVFAQIGDDPATRVDALEMVALGNRPPRVSPPTPSLNDDEVSGIALIEFTVFDEDDVVDLQIEFDNLDGAGFRPCRPAQADQTPVPTIQDVLADDENADGTSIAFFWDTNIDLPDADTDVLLRVTPSEDAEGQRVEGTAQVSTPAFRVDNNDQPIVQLDSGLTVANPDERRGIPVPYQVIDEEADLVDVLFQYRRPDEMFPELTTGDIGTILDDPDSPESQQLRRQKNVCTPFPRYAIGRVRVDAMPDTVILPELALRESWILANPLSEVAPLVGRPLELLRPSSLPSAPAWTSTQNPLSAPRAVLPLGDGRNALVLDSAGGAWNLLELELATGRIARTLASGIGEPTTLALELGSGDRFAPQAALLASRSGAVWTIDRVELATGTTSALVSSSSAPVPVPAAPVRGLGSLGSSALVFTAGSSLFFLDYRELGVPRLAEIANGLATPWGIAVDPAQPSRIFVSERDAHRILEYALDVRGSLPVATRGADLQPQALDAPESLELDARGTLLAVTRSAGDNRTISGIDLGARGRNIAFVIGQPVATSDVGNVAAGPEGLLLLAVPTRREILVGGGIEQRRTIVAYEPGTQRTMVDTAFEPAPSNGQPWRVQADTGERLKGDTTAKPATFLWNSAADLLGGDGVFLRAVPRDNELGVISEGVAQKTVRHPLNVAPRIQGGRCETRYPVCVASADLDGDGDMDLVSANGSILNRINAPDAPGLGNLQIYHQTSPATFVLGPAVPAPGSCSANPPIPSMDPTFVVAADLNGDDLADLVFSDERADSLVVLSAPSFAVSQTYGGPGTTLDPSGVAVADFDHDGRLDLVSSNMGIDTLTIFGNTGSGFVLKHTLFALDVMDEPSRVAAGDLNGDGLVDVVSSNRLSHNLTVFFQSSLGSFLPDPLVVAVGTNSFPNFVQVIDVDGDGAQDLVSTNGGNVLLPDARNDVTVFFQTGPGAFGASLVLGDREATFGAYSTAVADLDADGDQDLAVAAARGDSLAVFFQREPRQFDRSLQLVLDRFSSPHSVLAADLDGDGDQDLVSANRGSLEDPKLERPLIELHTNLTIFVQNSPGKFDSPHLTLGDSTNTFGPRSVAAADMDGDGDHDLVSANLGRDTFAIFTQNAPGRFDGIPLQLGGTAQTDNPTSVATADLDGDGDQDFVANSDKDQNKDPSLRDRLVLHFQLAPRNFFFRPLGHQSIVQVSFVTVADVNHDGGLDIAAVTGDSTTESISLFHQTAPGVFTLHTTIPGGAPSAVLAADLDRDGLADLATADRLNNRLRTYYQGPLGTFLADDELTGMTAPVHVAAADMDRDGDLDLLSANTGSDDLTVFRNLGPRVFGTTPSLRLRDDSDPGNPFVDPIWVTPADLDGDGDPEIVSAQSPTNSLIGHGLAVYVQNWPGVYEQPPSRLATPREPSAVLALDIDGDGDQDLVSANKNGNNLTLFFGAR